MMDRFMKGMEAAKEAEQAARNEAKGIPSCEKLAEFYEKVAVAFEGGGGQDAMKNAMEEMGLTQDGMSHCISMDGTEMKAGYEVP